MLIREAIIAFARQTSPTPAARIVKYSSIPAALWRVCRHLHVCSVRKLEDAAQLGQDLGDSFTPLVFDVTEAAAVQAAADKVGNHLKGRTLQALINNAGIGVLAMSCCTTSLE